MRSEGEGGEGITSLYSSYSPSPDKDRISKSMPDGERVSK